MGGLDEELGIGNEGGEETAKIVNIADAQPKRKPFHYWKVGDREIKLKLKASMIVKTEEKIRKNILDVLNDTPKLNEMLIVIQAAAAPWQHKMSFNDVQKLYDTWIDEDGGDLTMFIKKVFMPTLIVSGFFPREQEADILESLAEIDGE